MSAKYKFLIIGATRYEKMTWEAKTTSTPGILEFIPNTPLTNAPGIFNKARIDVTFDSKNYEVVLVYRNSNGSGLALQTVGQYLQSPSFDTPAGPYEKGEIGVWHNILANQSGVYISVVYELVNYYGSRLLYRGPKRNFTWGSVRTVDHPHVYRGPRRLVQTSENAKFVYLISAAFDFKVGDVYHVRFNIDTLAMSYFEQITDESNNSRLWSRFEIGQGVPRDTADKRAMGHDATPQVVALYEDESDTHWLYYFHLGWK